MNKKKIILILVVVLVIVVLFYKKKIDKTIPVDYFKISDTTSVSQFSLIGKSDTLIFSRNSTWMINNKWRAKTSHINSFLNTMKRIEIKVPIKGESYLRYLDSVQKHGVNVIIQDQEKRILSFTFYENYSNNLINSFFLDNNTKKLFLVKIPAYYGKLNRYFSTSVKDWKDNTLLQFKNYEIASIEVKYMDQSQLSYKVEIDTLSNYNLYNQLDERLYCIPSTIGRYFSYFQNISFVQQVIFEEVKYNEKVKIIARLKVTNKKGRQYIYEYFSLPSEIFEGKTIFDLNYALIKNVNDNQFFKVRYVELDLLFKDIQYFK